MADPIIEMQDAIEEKARDKLLAHAGLAPLMVIYRGEPSIVPVKLHPFGVLFLESLVETTGQEGYGAMTGMRYYRYDGYFNAEVLHRDVVGLMPSLARKADVPSYLDAKALAQAALDAFIEWGGADGRRIAEDPAQSVDTRAETVELRTDTIRFGLNRRDNNVTNTGSFEFHFYVRVTDFGP